ncbi:molecular chaperone GrpE (heat shock protein) [Schinkia azotoformans MEV2011]|uniref:Protein GrpE n=1 Tax=Schinkia azotoformans MEV2011 TaxID=1348973 RepID=A0A072NL22_SCHAZ|nr:nucleotide exchange factor GrpE [Schinkia azotoformans]KEF38126.1 molecular chaperone GrpE (heat shock protein) [Schinkia azotoformans MEV2011]MEC1696687.1 nucleotide exchange factor GrpE [Schinkia azotoformans]MEC1715607.1 nucleotide exchange factor GrpE [Schinkia azotoformans]MEC1726161.1 nucleotide exchange factor GrpE [Schinkia azotoformans]MEC1742149.1 nucleotide exchange factor GrpE [Schinkia azotoformans]
MVNKNYSQEEANDEKVAKAALNNDSVTESTEQNIDNQAESIQEEEVNEVSPEQLEIQRLQQELDDRQSRLLRLQADLENFRRRVRLDQEAAAKYRAQSLIENILPALDNFDRALNIEAKEEETLQLLKGVEMVHRQLLDALKTEGLDIIDAVGKEFDPNFHQAVMQVEDSNYESNIVVDELQKGYILKDRVIRPTMVKVNQ